MNANNISRLPTSLSASAMSRLNTGYVTGGSEDNWQIEQQFSATRAASCLLTPSIGDLVIYALVQQQTFIIAIVNRKNQQENLQVSQKISIPKAQHIELVAPTVTVNGYHKLQLQSFDEISIDSVLGKISLTAKDFIQSIQQTLLQYCQQFFSKSEYADSTVNQISRQHAKHHLITAQKEMKIDAERINMG